MKNPEPNLQAILAALFPFRPSQWPSEATLKHACPATLHVARAEMFKKGSLTTVSDLIFPMIEFDIGCAPLSWCRVLQALPSMTNLFRIMECPRKWITNDARLRHSPIVARNYCICGALFGFWQGYLKLPMIEKNQPSSQQCETLLSPSHRQRCTIASIWTPPAS